MVPLDVLSQIWFCKKIKIDVRRGYGPSAAADAKKIHAIMYIFEDDLIADILQKYGNFKIYLMKRFLFSCNQIHIIILKLYQRFCVKILSQKSSAKIIISDFVLEFKFSFRSCRFLWFLHAINRDDFFSPSWKRRRLLAVNWTDWKKSLHFCDFC